MFELIEKSCLFIVNTLYHQTIFCIILFILIFGIAFILKEKSPRWQLCLWFLILIRLILPTDFSHSFSARNLAADFLSSDSFNALVENVSERMGLTRQPDQISALNVYGSIEAVNNNRAQVSFEPDKEKNKYVSLPIILSIVWILGCLVFLFLFLSKIYNIRRMLNRSSLVRDKTVTAFVDYWRKSFKIKRPVAVLSSDRYLSPFTVGVFRPRIFIPEQLLEDMNRETINSIIAHEMVHIKRFDHLWIRLQNVIQIIYFFNPVVWYASKQLNMARERLCDSEVLARRVIAPKAFGKSVIDVLKFNLSGCRFIDPLLCFSSHKKVFEYRIRDILKEKSMSKQKTVFSFLIVCLLGLFLLPMSSAKPEKNIPESPYEYISVIPEKSRNTMASDRIAAVAQDDVKSPLKRINRIDEITGQKAEENNIGDKQNNLEKREKDRDVPVNKKLNQKKTVVELPQVSAKTIKINNEDSFVLASNKKILNFSDSATPELYESGSEQDMVTSEVIKQVQDSPPDYKSRGMSYLEKGQIDDAISALNKAVELNPEDASAYFYRGNAYFKNEQYDRALSDYSKTVDINPGYIEAYLNRAKIYHDVKNMYKSAISDYSRAIELNPGDAGIYYLRGKVTLGYEFDDHSVYPTQVRLIRKRDERRALSDFNKAIKLDPGHDNAYVSKGYIYFKRGDFLKAIEINEKALDINPDNALAKRLQLYYFDMRQLADWP